MKINLTDKREIELIELNQSLHYKSGLGVNTGVPDEDLNDWFLEDLEKEHQNNFGSVELIPPKRYRKAEIEIANGVKYSDDIEIELLPSVLCIGTFKSTEPIRNTNGDYSLLKIIWFQENYAYPIDKSILDVLVNIDWNTKAKNIKYDDYLQ